MTNKKMRGLVVSTTSLLIFCACFLVGIGLAAAAPSVSIDPALVDGLAPGDVFSVDVNVDSDGSTLSALELNLEYDNAFSVTGATYSGLMGPQGSDVFIVQDLADDGEISFAIADATPATQDGTLLTVDFEVNVGAADGLYLLDLMDVMLVNGGAAMPGVVINDGEAEIGDGVVVPGEDPFVQIVADPGVFGEGDVFDAVVGLDSVDDTVSAVEFDMMYHSGALSVTGATYNGLMGPEGTDVFIVQDLTDDGEISFALADATPFPQAGDFLTIHFEVKAGAADGFYDLDLKDVTVVDGAAPLPDLDVFDDTVELSSVPTVPPVEGIELMPGWSLISIPETLENASIDNVLQDFNSSVIDSIFYDNACTGAMEVPTDFEPLKAYWIHNNLTESVVINDDYLVPQVPSTPASLTLCEGWNAIGHTADVELSAEISLTSIDDCYSKVKGPWMPTTNEYAFVGYNGVEGVINGNHVGTDVFDMNMYEGFYVFVDEECVLA
ncbi:cohesin domain-containing protein [Methanolobus sp. ZRKC3]|uniref:cohesin domain-containing protein n=1 Tax=Methanolobus sp. ZRKC3 TaxID=3125786 RepID=UPI00324DE7FD